MSGVLPLPSPNWAPGNLSTSPAGAPQQITKIFPFQSYFDATFETIPSNALLPQPTNNGIIQSTAQDRNQTEAYAVGLAPWSEVPVAVQMQSGDAGGLSSPVVLRPGMVFSPAGLTRGAEFKTFRGLQWGLPFGWLGGGLATLFLFKSPDTLPNWTFGAREVCFHKFQTTIIAANAVPPAPMYWNWPTRFPWGRAFRGASGIAQNGDPNLSVSPSKTLLRLNGVGLAAAASCRVVFWGTDTFDSTSAGLNPSAQPAIAQSAYYEFSWPANTAGGWPAHQPVVTLPEEFNAIAANAFGITIEALDAALIGATVNVVRYGMI